MRERILAEIVMLATAAGGTPPGKLAFARQTGIRESVWSGRIWARWSDTLADAGFTPNSLQGRIQSKEMLEAVVQACRHYGRIPTVAELKLYKQENPGFPSKGAISGHFGTRAGLVEALARHAFNSEGLRDIAAMTAVEPRISKVDTNTVRIKEGHVYLLQSGEFYKIGRSEELERRVREVRVAMPESLTLVYSIRTDDPSGIEAYWHRRFASQRRNGEWFKLSAVDVAAFRRRKYQ